MTMASSTTRPTESTMASSVSRLMVKPATFARNTAPISETGIATTGMMSPRIEPRNRKITSTTMRSVSVSVLSTSWMDCWMYSVESVGDSRLHAHRQLTLEVVHRLAHVLDDLQGVRRGEHPHADERGALAVET